MNYTNKPKKGFLSEIKNNKPITIPATPDVGNPSTANDTNVFYIHQFIFTFNNSYLKFKLTQKLNKINIRIMSV